MNTPTYRITFNKIDPNGFSISDLKEIEFAMNKCNIDFLNSSVIMNKLEQSEYKLIYEIVPSCNFEINSLNDYEVWSNIGMFYKKIIYPFFKATEQMDRFKVTTSVDFSNFYHKEAHYKYILSIDNKEIGFELIKFINEMFIKNNELNNNLMIFLTIEENKELPNIELFKIYSNSILPIAAVEDYYYNKYGKKIEFYTEYSPTHISDSFNKYINDINSNKINPLKLNNIL